MSSAAALPRDPGALLIKVRPDYVAAVSAFVPFNYPAATSGLRFEPSPTGGVIVIAADSMALIVLHDPEGFANRAATVALEPACVDRLRKEVDKRAYSKVPPVLCIESVSGSPWLNTVNMSPEPLRPAERVTHYAAEIDGDFPNWRGVARSAGVDIGGPGASRPMIGSNLVRKLAKALEAVDSHYFPPVHYATHGPNSPVIARSPAFGDGFVVIMPIRVEQDERDRLAWDGLPEFAEVAA